MRPSALARRIAAWLVLLGSPSWSASLVRAQQQALVDVDAEEARTHEPSQPLEVATSQVGVPAAAAAPAPEAPSAQAAGHQPARAQSLLRERERWLSSPVELTTPIALLTIGVAMAVVGWAVLVPASNDRACDAGDTQSRCSVSGTRIVGMVIGTSGIALALAGSALLPSRIASRRRRGRELRRIDAELGQLGVQLALAPWLSRTSAVSGAGLATTVRF